MGWGRLFLMGDVGQQEDINEVKAYLDDAITQINENSEVDDEQSAQIRRLVKENRELKLYTLGLVRLLSSKGIISPAELRGMVTTVEQGVSGGQESG